MPEGSLRRRKAQGLHPVAPAKHKRRAGRACRAPHLTFSTSAGAGCWRACARWSAAPTPPAIRGPAPALYGWSPKARSASFRNAALACTSAPVCFTERLRRPCEAWLSSRPTCSPPAACPLGLLPEQVLELASQPAASTKSLTTAGHGGRAHLDALPRPCALGWQGAEQLPAAGCQNVEVNVQYRCPYKLVYFFLFARNVQAERGESGVAPMARAQPRKVVLPPRHLPLCFTPILPHRMNAP